MFFSNNKCSAVSGTIVGSEGLPSLLSPNSITGERSFGSFEFFSSISVVLFLTQRVVVKSMPNIIGGSPAIKNAAVYDLYVSYIQPERKTNNHSGIIFCNRPFDEYTTPVNYTMYIVGNTNLAYRRSAVPLSSEWNKGPGCIRWLARRLFGRINRRRSGPWRWRNSRRRFPLATWCPRA